METETKRKTKTDTETETNDNKYLLAIASPFWCLIYPWFLFRTLRSKFWHSGRRTSQKSHTDTAQPNFLPRHSETEYIECQMLLHTSWHLYCPWVSATITHLTCAVSDLLPLLPDLSSHCLQIPGISSIFRSSSVCFGCRMR